RDDARRMPLTADLDFDLGARVRRFGSDERGRDVLAAERGRGRPAADLARRGASIEDLITGPSRRAPVHHEARDLRVTAAASLVDQRLLADEAGFVELH